MERSPLPRRSLAAAIFVVAVFLYATSGRYGYHRDELYFRMLPIQWGYVDQPFLTPLLAKASVHLFGDTLVGLRGLAPVLLAAGILLAALTVRELGGSSRAQALGAWGYASASLPLLSGHYLVTGTVDLTLWAAALLAITRALLRDPRWWLVAGAVLGLAADNKLLVAVLVIALAVGLLLVGPRDVLRSTYLWAGALLALVIASPTLVYQATHGWPQVSMAGALHDNNAGEVRAQVIPYQVLLIGPPVFLVAVAGFLALLRRPEWRRLRALAVAYPVALAINFVAGGQIYYAFGLLAFLLAAGWAAVRDRRWLVWLIAVNGLVSAFIALPLLPVRHTQVQAAVNPTVGDQVGWPAYVDTLRSAVHDLTPAERSRAVVFTSNYGEAGAVDRYGPDLPPAYSGQNELHEQGPPPPDRDVVVAWTENEDATRRHFEDCRRVATMDNGVGVDNEEQGSRVLVCRLRAGGWDAVWPSLQHYD